MPIHSSENTHLIVSRVQRLRPQHVLDIGCGSGSYGLLFRDVLDRMRGRYHRNTWQVCIDAIDVWSDYITPVHKYVYNTIVITNILDAVVGWPDELWPHYDLMFLGDIIEHLKVAGARWMIQGLQTRAGEILLSTPVSPARQGSYLGNMHETHVSKWTPKMLQDDLGFQILSVGKELITAKWSAPR